MTTQERKVTVELVAFGQVKEYVTLPASEAAEYLGRNMTKGHRWRITPPDRTGELPNDERRYADDCAACGVPNPYENV